MPSQWVEWSVRSADPVEAGPLRVTPQDRILVETDAPFLAPVPYRGKPNLPQRLVHTHALIAEVRGQDGRELAELTTANARRVFGLAVA